MATGETVFMVRHRSALDTSTTQWDRADTREVTKGTSP